MKIKYQKEVKVWMGFQVPVEDILRHNHVLNTTNVDDLLDIEKAEGNGLRIWDYFDEDCFEGMSFSDCEETGETWQDEESTSYDGDSDVEITTFGQLLSMPEIMGDKELLDKLINTIKSHKEGK